MGLSLCGLGSSKAMYNKPLCGKLRIFKASFASKGEKASVSLFHLHSPPNLKHGEAMQEPHTLEKGAPRDSKGQRNQSS